MDWFDETYKVRNERFIQLSPEQKRVQIAEDVISLLNFRRITATEGRYFWMDVVDRSTGALINEDTSLNVLLERGQACQVCALGAMFTAVVLNVNDAKGVRHIFHSGIQEKLLRFFDEEQLTLIEAAFECDPDVSGDFEDLDRDQRWMRELAADFAIDISCPEERMMAIMQSIIEHNGTFVP